MSASGRGKVEAEPHLGPLVVEKGARVAEFKKRKQRVMQKRCSSLEAIALIGTNEWVERKKLKNDRIVIEKPRRHDEILEDRFWCILYQMGFKEINQGRQFTIRVTSESKYVNKQIDVFAVSDDVVVVAECKSNSKRQARQLSKEIGEFASYQRPIANSLRSHYKNSFKKKIIWLFVTSNIKWSQPDRARAKEQNIQIIEERELRYYEEISKIIGPAARYQFLSEFLSDQKIPTLSNYSVPAIRAKLGGNLAYYFLAPAERILPIAFVNHRALRDIQGAPAYQRVLTRSRLKEIGAYISEDGFFPNNILINFKDDVRFDKQFSLEERHIAIGQLYLPDRFKSAWVIDGQHRLYGYTEVEDESRKSVIPILAFEKLSTRSEAELFATINSKQRKVMPGLLDELAGELNLNSDDFSERIRAVASRAISLMGSEPGGPFEDRVKTADLDDSDTICLTISSIKNAIVSSRLIGEVSRSGTEVPGPLSRGNPTETVDALCEALTEFFDRVRQANSIRWELGRPGYLCANIAVQAYIRLLAALVQYMTEQTRQNPLDLEPAEIIDQITHYMEPILDFVQATEDAEFEKRFKQRPGSGGPPRYYFQLCLLVRSKFPSFNPPDFESLQLETKSAETEKADALNKNVVDRVHNHVVNVLKQNFGGEYFERGIPQKEIKISALARKYDDDAPMPPENYLDVIDLKKIVEHKQNWEIFRPTMSIQLPTESKGQAKYVRWLETLNEVRRIPAHPFGRAYKDADLEFLEFVSEQLESRGV